MQGIRVFGKTVSIIAVLFALGLQAQTYWQEVGIRKFETFNDAKTYCTNSLNSDQCERASIIPAQTLGTYPYAYPAHALTYLLVYPMEHSESPDAMVDGYSNNLPSSTDFIAGSCPVKILSVGLLAETSDKASAFTASDSLSSLQRRGVALLVSPFSSESQLNRLIFRYEICSN